MLLDNNAMQSFIADGFLLLDTTAELTPRWHSSVVQKAARVVAAQPAQRTRLSSVAPAGAAVDQATLWEAMSPELQCVIGSHTVCGALASILGHDFIMSAGGHMHEAASLYQFWHRDGTVRGIREHAPRGLILMYYPNGCTLEMGCTAVCRGSQFLTVDRHRWPNSEDRLDVGLPPQASMSDEEALAHWRVLDEEARRVPRIDDPIAREEALATPISTLGLHAVDAELRVVVPPGGVILCHRECFHRATRPVEGAAWRPMFKMGASRVCDPVSPSWAFYGYPKVTRERKPSDSPTFDAIARALWCWHCGGGIVSQESADTDCTEPEVNAALAFSADPAVTEAARISAAYLLAERITTCHGAPSAVAARHLLQSLDAKTENVRRAATYGLRAALLTQTMQQPNPQQQYLADSLLIRLQAPFKACGGTVGGSAAVVYALAAAPMPYKATATALAAFVAWTVVELADHTTAQPESLLDQWCPLLSDRVQFEVPLDFGVLDRRLALSECCGALAAVGERAVCAGECETVDLVAEVLLSLVTKVEPGEKFPTYFGPANGQTIRMQAAFALLRVCSDPNRFFGGSDHHGSIVLRSRAEWVGIPYVRGIQPQHDTVAATLAEAIRRLRLICDAPSPSQRPGPDGTQRAREHLLSMLQPTMLPWRSISLEDESQPNSGVLLQHCSTAAPFPTVTEVGVHSSFNHND